MDAFSTVEVIVARCQVPTSFLSPSRSRARLKGEPTDARSAGRDRAVRWGVDSALPSARHGGLRLISLQGNPGELGKQRGAPAATSAATSPPTWRLRLTRGSGCDGGTSGSSVPMAPLGRGGMSSTDRFNFGRFF